MPQLIMNTLLTMPADRDPEDVATIISIYNKEIFEQKVTVWPRDYRIPPGTPENPSRLVVATGHWWKVVYSKNDSQDQMIEIPVRSGKLAQDIVNDYMHPLFGVAPGVAQPGLFVLKGDISIEKAKKEYAEKFAVAKMLQNKWFDALIGFADAAYASTNGNPRAINDDMRLAATVLGAKSKPWLMNYAEKALINCTACGAPRNPAYPICPNCKAVIDVAKAKELQLEFVK